MTMWIKVPTSTTSNFNITLGVTTSGGSRTVVLPVDSRLVEAEYDSGTETYTIGFVNRPAASIWTRVETPLAGQIYLLGGETLVSIDSITVPQKVFSFDDIIFTNCLNQETNVIGPGAIGQILRNRASSTDRWFLYDQVGSVIARTTSA